MILRLGDRGSAVVELQGLLNKHGASLAADGIFGPATEKAVRDFQRQAGLVVDGIAGPKRSEERRVGRGCRSGGGPGGQRKQGEMRQTAGAAGVRSSAAAAR